MFFSSSLIKIFFLRIYGASNYNPTKCASEEIDSNDSSMTDINVAEFFKNIESNSNPVEHVNPSRENSDSEESLNNQNNSDEIIILRPKKLKEILISKKDNHPYIEEYLDRVYYYSRYHNFLHMLNFSDDANKLYSMLNDIIKIIETETEVSENITEDLVKKKMELEKFKKYHQIPF